MKNRTSGVLLHPTSLPSKYGIGDLGDEAYRFVDFLEEARQGLWQVLPLGPTGYGDSPYQCFSAFAGNPLLVSPDRLALLGLVDKRELKQAPRFSVERVEYGPVIDFKSRLLRQAFDAFANGAAPELLEPYAAFQSASASWLDSYALFRTIKARSAGRAWIEWEPALALHDTAALSTISETMAYEIEAEKFAQFLFSMQWQELRRYCHERQIQILGDAPIFVAYDSADVWASRELFKLDDTGRPTVVAGVPPDYFSATGQLWGNPIYDWDRMRETGFKWWTDRLRAAFTVFDSVRLDHFRGFAATWEVPADAETAQSGEWVSVPGYELFVALRAALGPLAIVAEDLGLITPDVEELRDRLGFPGMRVLQFAFSGGSDSVHLPHNYVANSVVYTGTHDNETTVGWYRSAKGRDARRERTFCRDYLHLDPHEIHWSFIRAVFGSVARSAVVPMQDVLGLGAEARMNRPSSASGNWDWRLPPKALSVHVSHKLRDMTELYGRAVAREPRREPRKEIDP